MRSLSIFIIGLLLLPAVLANDPPQREPDFQQETPCGRIQMWTHEDPANPLPNGDPGRIIQMSGDLAAGCRVQAMATTGVACQQGVCASATGGATIERQEGWAVGPVKFCLTIRVPGTPPVDLDTTRTCTEPPTNEGRIPPLA